MYPVITYSSLVQKIDRLGVESCANEILVFLSENKVPFPLGKYFISECDALEKMERLRHDDGQFTKQVYRVRNDEVSFGFKCLPQFNGEYLLFIPNDTEYSQIDNLTCVFTDHSRLKSFRRVPWTVTKSPIDGWYQYGDYLLGSIQYCLERGQDINAYNLREGLYHSNNCHFTECAHERLTFLKTVFTHLKALLPDSSELRIFDLCAGWGDRLLVSIALDVEYLGIEPNQASHSGFKEAIQLFAPNNNNKFNVICDGCPDVVLPEYCKDGYYTLAFLSPPAFDSEFYSNDSTQSIIMFSNFDDWLLGFLISTLELAWRKLEIGGFLVIQSLLSAKINTFIYYFLEGSYYMGAISIRTGSYRNKPLWIWRKTDYNKRRRLDSNALHMALGKDVLRRYLDKKLKEGHNIY